MQQYAQISFNAIRLHLRELDHGQTTDKPKQYSKYYYRLNSMLQQYPTPSQLLAKKGDLNHVFIATKKYIKEKNSNCHSNLKFMQAQAKYMKNKVRIGYNKTRIRKIIINKKISETK